MKKLSVLLVFLLLLTGCGSGPKEMEAGMALRAKLLGAESVSFDAEITADYGEKLIDFAMGCTADRKGNVAFTVTAPETIAGITGTVNQSSGSLTFDGTALQFDLMADGLLSPVSAPWVLVKTLRSGPITSACREDGGIRLSMDDSFEDSALHLDVWLDADNLPTRAEIRREGRSILSLTVKNLVIS